MKDIGVDSMICRRCEHFMRGPHSQGINNAYPDPVFPSMLRHLGWQGSSRLLPRGSTPLPSTPRASAERQLRSRTEVVAHQPPRRLACPAGMQWRISACWVLTWNSAPQSSPGWGMITWAPAWVDQRTGSFPKKGCGPCHSKEP